MLLKRIRALFHSTLTFGARLHLRARFWRQRHDQRQAAELRSMSARELNDLGIGRGEIPYLMLNRLPGGKGCACLSPWHASREDRED